MKTIFKLFVLLSVALNMSCKRDNDFKQSDFLNISAGISVKTISKSIISGTSFPDNSKIGVQVLNSINGGIYEPGSPTNVEFVYNKSTNEWNPSNLFRLSSTKGKVYAYYPFASIGSNNELFSSIPICVPAIAGMGSEIDYLVAEPLDDPDELVSNSSGKNTANLSMKHSLAQVSFVVYKENYTGLGRFTMFTIEDAGETNFIKVSNIDETNLSMNIQSGSISGGDKGVITRILTTPCELTTTLPADNLQLLRSQVNATALVIPTSQINSGDLKFSFTIDGKTLSATNTTSILFEAGKQYIYKVKLSSINLSIMSITVVNWNPQSGDDIIIQ